MSDIGYPQEYIMFCFNRVSNWPLNIIYTLGTTGCSKHYDHAKGYGVFFCYSGTCLESFYVFSILFDYVSCVQESTIFANASYFGFFHFPFPWALS